GVEAGLFSMLGLFAKAFLVDAVIENLNTCKYFVVITEKREEISQFIIENLHHGVTVSNAVGAYTQNEKYMIHTVCKRIEAVRLRGKIKEIDPQAFIIVTTSSEIIGRGFRSV
ncbi:MAG: YitT family protein, partial [Clostridia bacterium]|nr:YitT family protein [Clostridia bacterium]